MAKKQKGSMTLFLSLILTLIFSLCFSLLEAARVHALSEIAERSLLLEMESAFGEYQPDLWAEYGLLFLNGGNEAGELDLAMLEGRRMEEAALEQKSTGFYQMALRSLEITGYSLATDNAGAAFKKEACTAIQAQLTDGAAGVLKEKFKQGEEMTEKSENLERQWESARAAMTEADEIERNQQESSSDTSENPSDNQAGKPKGTLPGKSTENLSDHQSGKLEKDLPKNPLESVDSLKKSWMLPLVVENPADISGKSIVLSDTLERRPKSQGNMDLSSDAALDKLWFSQYLNHYFSCITGEGKAGSEVHALDYELEYCIAGKGSDSENLEKVVKEMLLIREAGNFMTIMQDGKKQALALEIATAAVGFTGVMPLVKAVQVGILLAWSYVESILDMRCLLSGGKVPLVKAVSDWKSDVSIGEEVLTKKTEKTQNREDGLDYREYLQILLLLVREDTLVYRAMDIVERNIALKDSYFCMDCQLYGTRVEGLYTARPLFLGFVTAGNVKDGTYEFRESCKLAYSE